MDCKNMNLRRGSTGPLVTILEKYLHPLGLYPYKYDEIFGKGVYNGVVTRQKQLGLKPDGIFGPISCKAFGLSDPIPSPKPSNKPQLILDLQTALQGTINTVQDWINLLIKYGVYSHYDCMKYMTIATLNKYGIKLAIQRIRNGGLNCADYVALTIKVFEALILMGVKLTWKIKHVLCNDSKGNPDHESGHFLLSVTIDGVTEDCDPAEAASGKRGLTHNMCYYNYKEVIGNTLC